MLVLGGLGSPFLDLLGFSVNVRAIQREFVQGKLQA